MVNLNWALGVCWILACSLPVVLVGCDKSSNKVEASATQADDSDQNVSVSVQAKPRTAVVRAKEAGDSMAQLSKDIGDLLMDPDLTDEQIDEAGEDYRQKWENAMSKMIAAFEEASPDDKNEILDHYIDQETENQKLWYASNSGESKLSDQEIAKRKVRLFVGKTTGERKERSEKSSVATAVSQGKFYQAVQKRAKDRGVDMGWGKRG